MTAEKNIGIVTRTGNRKFVSDFLSMDRVWASEAIQSVTDQYWLMSNWVQYHDGKSYGLALILDQVKPTSVFLTGEPSCLAHIIRANLFGDEIFVEAPTSTLGVLKSVYHFETAFVMNKMVLKHFRETTAPSPSGIRRLQKEDAPRVLDLYQRVGETAPFDVQMFQDGVYYGVEKDGMLVSMAGTLVLCTDYRTATIGNVMTDKQYRNKGYAKACLVKLCQELLDKHFDCVCIKVNRGNTIGVGLYRRLGFVKALEYFEGQGKLRKN